MRPCLPPRNTPRRCLSILRPKTSSTTERQNRRALKRLANTKGLTLRCSIQAGRGAISPPNLLTPAPTTCSPRHRTANMPQAPSSSENLPSKRGRLRPSSASTGRPSPRWYTTVKFTPSPSLPKRALRAKASRWDLISATERRSRSGLQMPAASIWR